MKAFLISMTMVVLTLSNTAMAGHDGWRGGYGGHRDYGYRWREDFARWYADTALAQARQNHRYGCREKGNAWTTDWYDHYRWAMRAHRREAMRQVEIRDRRLARCGVYSYRR